jgi:hypothetical protein
VALSILHVSIVGSLPGIHHIRLCGYWQGPRPLCARDGLRGIQAPRFLQLASILNQPEDPDSYVIFITNLIMIIEIEWENTYEKESLDLFICDTVQKWM